MNAAPSGQNHGAAWGRQADLQAAIIAARGAVTAAGGMRFACVQNFVDVVHGFLSMRW